MNNQEEEFVKEAKARGYEVLSNGWPDFLVITPAKRVFCVEVKSPNNEVKDNQRRMHSILASAGIETVIYRNCWVDPIFDKEIEKLTNEEATLKEEWEALENTKILQTIEEKRQALQNLLNKMQGLYTQFTLSTDIFVKYYKESHQILEKKVNDVAHFETDISILANSIGKNKAHLDKLNHKEADDSGELKADVEV